MKHRICFLVAVLLLWGCSSNDQSGWRLAPGPLQTKWAADLHPDSAWQEYPRPQLVRTEWQNLNGLWKLAITDRDSLPKQYPYNILVPFPVESSLSGVGIRIQPQQAVWYTRTLEIPHNWAGLDVVLHFEASDWETTAWIDDQLLGSHRGGYNPFSFNLTEFVDPGSKHNLKVRVWDPTDTGFQPRGKQRQKPGGIFYTPSTGIWQTVWMEAVHAVHIRQLLLNTDIDQGILTIGTELTPAGPETELWVDVMKNGTTLCSERFKVGEPIALNISDPVLWSPDNPFLYDLNVKLMQHGNQLDEVQSYFGMRKISLKKDAQGFMRLALNNEILFQNGPLDQGFWPDGLNTPPSDAAMRYDVEITKNLGFNMLRKHVKVENRRFYNWCDRIGVLVWQDMPSAAGYVPPSRPDLDPSEEHKSQFEYELTQMISNLYNHPSIVMWVPFNEGWGQYDTKRIVELVREIDPTRLVNNASGWSDRNCGDVVDIHHYPDPRCPDAESFRASVLGEFGGLGLYVEGHTWQKENWGYEQMDAVDDLLLKYEDYYRTIHQMKEKNGLAAVVYTQTTDVESETNGLMTYDRDRVKMGVENIRKAHVLKTPPRLVSNIRQFVDSYRVDFVAPDSIAKILYATETTSEPDSFQLFVDPFIVDSDCSLKAKCIWPDGNSSRVIRYTLEKETPVESVEALVHKGLVVSIYNGSWDSLPEFDRLAPVTTGKTEKVGLDCCSDVENFGLEFTGFLDVPETDAYLVYLSSDDGARLYLDGEERIDYDGIHGPGIRKTTLVLEKGLHPFRLIYFQKKGGLGLQVAWESSTMQKQEIQSECWKHQPAR